MTHHIPLPKEDFNLDQLEAAIMDAIESGDTKNHSKVKRKSMSQLHIIPVTRRPLFPGMAAPIVIEPGIFYDVLKLVSKSSQKYIGLNLTKREDCLPSQAGFEDLYPVGVLAKVLRIVPIETGGAQVIVNIEKRITLQKAIKKKGHLIAEVKIHEDSKILSDELKAYSINIITTIKELLKLNPLFKEELQVFLGHSDFTEPGKLADFAVALTTASREELQEVLNTFNVQDRIDKALLLLKKELDISQLQNSINQKIEGMISKTQKEYYLREQLKTIKKELGVEKDDKTLDLDKFKTRIESKQIPSNILKVINEEMEKLSTLETVSSEYGICRNYLDWLTILPHGIFSENKLDLKDSKAILEEDHYGLDDIKERILEFISISKLSKSTKGSIICLVGPPGVGKTSIGKSIAKALGREFFRFSVGGMRDEAEIKGHRRTYIGAMPGKLIQALKYTETQNPVIMLDEIDKIGSSYHGDPASALLEVLDPEQNKEFLDHYLDVRIDLSHILFIVTANVLDTIPEALKDRMDILRLAGYIEEEKLEIATKYLIPKNLQEMGLKPSDISLSKDSLHSIISGYAREAGVRSLENYIKKILRKAAYKIVLAKEAKEKKKKHLITAENIEEYIGKPLFTSDRFYEKNPVGVVTGLAWTSMGGATLYIEAICTTSDKSEMKLTGQAGDVMKESSQIAWSFLQSQAAKYAGALPFFEKTLVHIHIPEGATPKDGPSAGVTMVSALLSLLLQQEVSSDIGMTGEITLTGKVLPVGGIKEKLIAARRSHLKEILLPKENLKDYDELPKTIKEGLKVHFIEYYDEIYELIFKKNKERTSQKRGKKV